MQPTLQPSARRPRRRVTFTLVLALALSGCGNLTAGGIGEATFVVSADAEEPPAPDPAVRRSIVESRALPAPARTEEEDEYDQPEGELEATLLLGLVRSDGIVLPLFDDEFEVSVDLEGVEEDETLPRELPADRYVQLRIVFLDIEVEVDAGLVIDGVEVTGPIDIELEGETLEVFKPLDLELGDRESVELLVDLNAAEWLRAVDPATSTVDAQLFADLVAVSVR